MTMGSVPTRIGVPAVSAGVRFGNVTWRRLVGVPVYRWFFMGVLSGLACCQGSAAAGWRPTWLPRAGQSRPEWLLLCPPPPGPVHLRHRMPLSWLGGRDHGIPLRCPSFRREKRSVLRHAHRLEGGDRV